MDLQGLVEQMLDLPARVERRPGVLSRLLDRRATAAYLGGFASTVRGLEAAGVLRRVRGPLPDSSELRKLLFDRTDLDRLIEPWKESGA